MHYDKKPDAMEAKKKLLVKQRYFKRQIGEISRGKTWTRLRKGNLMRKTKSGPIESQNNAKGPISNVKIDNEQKNSNSWLYGKKKTKRLITLVNVANYLKIPAKRPDFVLINSRKKKNEVVIEWTMPFRVKIKESEKIVKYFDLSRELKNNVECEENGETYCSWCA